MNHLTHDDIANILDGAADDHARAHLRQCTQCADMLKREAALDEDVEALVSELRFCPGCTKPTAGPVDRCSFCGVAFAPGGMRVECVLNESDHGRLYLAHGPDGLVALKEIVFARVPDVEALDRFEREARLLKQLRHDRIPRYVASFSEGEGVHLRLYLAQRYVDGPALLEELESRRFSEEEARGIAREVLSILVDLQALSPPVIHRDVKPANLVRDNDGKLSLVDFGSARDVAKTTGGTLVGTFGYMPVEQLSGVVDESTDVYALGATLVHVLTRRPPWETLPSGSLPSSLRVSSSFKAFLARCLAPRDRRFANARAALAGLDAKAPLRRPILVGMALAATIGAGAAGSNAYVGWRAQQLEQQTIDATPAVVAPAVVAPVEQNDEQAVLEQQLRKADLNIDQYIGDIVACGRKSTYIGELVAEFTVTNLGEVKDVVVRGNDDARLVSCMTRAIRGWEFPRHEGGDIYVERTFDFAGGEEVRQKTYSGKKVTMDLQDADLGNVIRLIGNVAGKNVVYGPDVKGKVTTQFKNVPWDQALDQILQTFDLVAEEQNGTILVRKRIL